MKTKNYLYTGVAILVIVLLVFLFKKPDYPLLDTPRPTAGNPDAKVTIVEFSDLQCPACGAAHPVMKNILEEFGENISFEYKHFPLLQIHPFALMAAEAAECANDQGKFFPFIDKAFSNQEQLQKTYLRRYAEELDLDMDKFNACLGSGVKKQVVMLDQRQGVAKNIQGTPTFFINGKQLPDWRYDKFKEAILIEINNKE